ncbi:MAG TPA: helix-turn-helix transcriptional regulator [Mucilaginibacter sp.]|nr:helix-turn-helix transcriptional regulator [Mucilaginibacter sp.]
MDVRTFLPYSKIVKKPVAKAVPENPQTLGEHILKKRLEGGLLQKDVARIMGVSEDCITYWENGRSNPQIRYYPAIIAFLGYYPFTHETKSIAGKLLKIRYSHGWSRKLCAKEFKVDSVTIKRLERKKMNISREFQLKLLIVYKQITTA